MKFTHPSKDRSTGKTSNPWRSNRWDNFEKYLLLGFESLFITRVHEYITEDSCTDCREGFPCRVTFSGHCIVRLINEDLKKSTSISNISVLKKFSDLDIHYILTKVFAGGFKIIIRIANFNTAFLVIFLFDDNPGYRPPKVTELQGFTSGSFGFKNLNPDLTVII